MDQNPFNNNNNRLYNTITNSCIIAFVGNIIYRYSNPEIAAFLMMTAFYNANQDDLNNIVEDFIDNLRNNEELVNLANQIIFTHLFGTLNIQDGGGGNGENKYDDQINDFEVALGKFCENKNNKNNLDKLKKKFNNVFCTPGTSGGMMKQKTYRKKNKKNRKSRKNY